MKKYIIIAIAIFGIFLMPHFSHAAIIYDNRSIVGTSTAMNVGEQGCGGGCRTPSYLGQVSVDVPIGNSVYYEYWSESNLYWQSVQSVGDILTTHTDNTYSGGVAEWGPNGTINNASIGIATGTMPWQSGTLLTNPYLRFLWGSLSNYPRIIGGNGTLPYLCISTIEGECENNAPTISFLNPTQSSTVAEFSQWFLTTTNVTSTDLYTAKIIYWIGQMPFTDQVNYYGEYLNPAIVNKSVALSSTATTTWNAIAELLNASGTLIATSSQISFSVIPNTTTTIVYPTSTSLTATTTPFLIATSTCSGWADITCEMGNWSTGVFNFLFGIDENTIQSIAGFSFATQAPFNIIPDIQNDFANIDTSNQSIASSSISFSLGGDTENVTFFSQATIEEFMGNDFISFIRNLILAILTIAMFFGWYIEIKNIFKSK